ncbi:MAG: HupE/UreJ family protein [Acidimicrobiia bacterium]
MITQPSQSKRLASRTVIGMSQRGHVHRRTQAISSISTSLRRVAIVSLFVAGALVGFSGIAIGHEDQVIEYGSFLAGLTHPVLGLDHFLAMVSVGIVSALIGGRAIWTVPATFVVMMAVGGIAGYADIGISTAAVEFGIATSVILLGAVMLLDRRLDVRVAMLFVAFFGFFHGYAHGQEIPDIAEPAVYALGFLLGTVLIHLLGVLFGDIATRYTYGRIALRVIGGVFMVIGFLFIVGVM